jgi:hypothetical protein
MAKKKNRTTYKGYRIDIQFDGSMYYVSIEDAVGRVVNTFGDDGFDSKSYAKSSAKYWVDRRTMVHAF